MRINHINKTYREEVLNSENALSKFESAHVRRLVKLNCYKSLKHAYVELSQILNAKYPDIVLRTNSEREISKLLSKNTRLVFQTSVWIGPYNFDIYFDQIRSDKNHQMRGLVIELDGAIHNLQFKMSKDQHKYEFLQIHLSIGMTSIPNEETKHKMVIKIANRVNSLCRLDHRARIRQRIQVYAATLVAHCCLKDLSTQYNLHI